LLRTHPTSISLHDALPIWTKIRSQMAPTHLANVYCTWRERNQRMPSTATRPGSRKAPIPKNCNRTSDVIAPTIPIQLRNHIGCRSEEHTSELQSRGHLVCR